MDMREATLQASLGLARRATTWRKRAEKIRQMRATKLKLLFFFVLCCRWGRQFRYRGRHLSPEPHGYTLSDLNITGNSVEVEFFQTDIWMMIGEVAFEGTSAPVPEPATWALFGWRYWPVAAGPQEQDHLDRGGIFPEARFDC